jgi:hypothetical protein
LSVRLPIAASFAALATLISIPAVAQRPPAPEGIRVDPRKYDSPQNFALEIRVGAYQPEVDSDPDLNGRTPYASSFGDKPRVMLGLEVDWQALRIPHVGVLGPGIGAATTSASRPAKTESGTASSEDMSFTVQPFYGLAVFRLDGFLLDSGFPLVPYAKAGLVYALWRASTTAGTSEFTRPDGTVVKGKGGTWGYHGALGVAFNLGAIDRSSERQLDQAIGINHTYAFGEWMISKIDGAFGQDRPMRVGDSTWTLGLAFDF